MSSVVYNSKSVDLIDKALVKFIWKSDLASKDTEHECATNNEGFYWFFSNHSTWENKVIKS